MKEPVRGTAQVVSATAHRGDASWQDIRMMLTVRAEGVPPTAVEHEGMCRADKWPTPGDELPVTLDRHKPERLEVEWDEVQSGRERARETAERMAAAEASGAEPPEAGSAPSAVGFDLDALRKAFPGATIDVQTHEVDATQDPAAARKVLEALQAAHGAEPDAADDAGDRIAALERLAKLRESGALTEAEFEAEKARILGGD